MTKTSQNPLRKSVVFITKVSLLTANFETGFPCFILAIRH